MLQKDYNFLKDLIIFLIVAIIIFGTGYVYRTVTERSLVSDKSIVAVDLARQKMEMVLAKKASSEYNDIISQSDEVVYNGRWIFIRKVEVNFVDPENFFIIDRDLGLKKIDVNVAWGGSIGSQVSLYSLVSNQIPKKIGKINCPRCSLQ